jgi:hypothetical protein
MATAPPQQEIPAATEPAAEQKPTDAPPVSADAIQAALYAAPEPQRADTLDFDKIRSEADAILVSNRYRGKLTSSILRQLEPLMYTRIPEEYLHFSPQTTGKPYDSTGIRSLQVQVDLANAVLGAAHWRLLTYYPIKGDRPDPTTCHAWVIIGSNLQPAEVAPDGDSVEANGATILAARDGWGGIKRGNHEGDERKGSQTNAAKRALAHAGFGANVYRLDFDEELVDGMAPAATPAAASRAETRSANTGRAAPAPAQQGQKKRSPVQALTALLGQDDPLREMRERANTGMELCGMTPEKRLGWLTESGGTVEELQSLIDRAERALEAKEAADGAETPES